MERLLVKEKPFLLFTKIHFPYIYFCTIYRVYEISYLPVYSLIPCFPCL
jgi:hypothetical protein